MEELVWVLWVETEIKESILSVVDPGMLSIIDSRSSPQSHFGDQVKKKKKNAVGYTYMAIFVFRSGYKIVICKQ